MTDKGSLTIYFGEHTDDILKKVKNKHNIINPEINLHPRNQRKIARDIAWRVMNAGQDIMLWTCSDFIIKELNLLIRFNKKEDKERMLEIAKTNGYSEKDFLDYSLINIHFIREWLVLHDPESVIEDGIYVSCLDDVIVNMNKIEDEIGFGA